jgi:repressor LexA
MVVTDRQYQILAFIRSFQAREGFGPSVREISQALGLASPGSLKKHLDALVREGELTHQPGKKRTWQLTSRSAGPSIPLLGRIAAGTPILAQENRESDLPVAPELFGCDASFALRVSGDSMIDAQIRDGDLAIIRPQDQAEDGQIGAVQVEGLETEATLKRLRRRKGRIELHPPIRLTNRWSLKAPSSPGSASWAVWSVSSARIPDPGMPFHSLRSNIRTPCFTICMIDHAGKTLRIRHARTKCVMPVIILRASAISFHHLSAWPPLSRRLSEICPTFSSRLTCSRA